jgi:hypothetical protein
MRTTKSAFLPADKVVIYLSDSCPFSRKFEAKMKAGALRGLANDILIHRGGKHSKLHEHYPQWFVGSKLSRTKRRETGSDMAELKAVLPEVGGGG